MGTETINVPIIVNTAIGGEVKLNNPQMGTETYLLE